MVAGRAAISCSAGHGHAQPSHAPKAARRPTTVHIGQVDGENRGENPMAPAVCIEDPYFWLRDDERSSQEVLDHLRAENAYTEASVAHLADFRTQLNRELRGHLQETDQEYALPRGPFEYYRRTVEGLSYPVHCRRPLGLNDEEVLLDENLLAEGKTYCSVDEVEPSPQQRLLAFTADFSGFETYDLYVRRLGEHAPSSSASEEPELKEVAGFAWGSEDETDMYYLTFDEAHRPDAVFRHVLGTPQESDERLFLEEDERFNVNVHRSRDGQLLLVSSDSTETSEVHYLKLGSPGRLCCVRQRQTGLRYSVDHRRGTLYMVTNEGGLKNQVIRSCELESSEGPWRPLMCSRPDGMAEEEVLPHSESRSLETVHAFDGFLAITGREDGLSQVWILQEGNVLHRIAWPYDAYWCDVDEKTEFTSPSLRLECSTLVLPKTSMAYDIPERRLETLRTKPVPGYDPSLYATRRIEATATDGTAIPISLLWRRNLRAAPGEETPEGAVASSTGALHLYGYGSYGMSVDPSFSITRLPLVDRGMVYAIAHVRGGGEMGRWKWYEEGGKYLQKKNTFTDFVSCAEHLLAEGWAAAGSERLSIEGRSAGGLLVGAALNLRPDLFGAAVAGVPFVDVLVTMSDPSIPLTCGEWEEWGNPNEEKYFEYMQSYSPIDNIRDARYPPVLITAGLYDPRVAFWEPAKYAQKLRETHTNVGDCEVLLKMDLDTGHFSASDRYKYLEETAFDQAWLLSKMGLGP